MSPEEPPFVFSDEVKKAAGGVSKVTMWKWVQLGILPKPTLVGKGYRGSTRNRFPAEAIDRVKRLRELQAQHFTLAEIAEIIADEFEP